MGIIVKNGELKLLYSYVARFFYIFRKFFIKGSFCKSRNAICRADFGSGGFVQMCRGFFTKKYYRNGFINDRVWKKLVRIRK